MEGTICERCNKMICESLTCGCDDVAKAVAKLAEVTERLHGDGTDAEVCHDIRSILSAEREVLAVVDGQYYDDIEEIGRILRDVEGKFRVVVLRGESEGGDG